MEDANFLINYYLKELEAFDNLSHTDKEAIYAGLSVAAYSPRLWISYIDGGL